MSFSFFNNKVSLLGFAFLSLCPIAGSWDGSAVAELLGAFHLAKMDVFVRWAVKEAI